MSMRCVDARPCSLYGIRFLYLSSSEVQISRIGSLGPSGAVTTGIAFGLPPILKFGSSKLQERFVPDLITGRKRICIAITEPSAGSDVANIATTAVKSVDGSHYIVNGTKKWYRPNFD